jgi:hypothetical protein
MAEWMGVQPRVGGSHPQWGTRNTLLGLERGAYLEVVAPDPALEPPPGGRGFGVDEAGPGRLVTWAARVGDLRAAARELAAAGVAPGEVSSGSRLRPDGVLLQWTQTDPLEDRLGGTVPFLLDWGATPHPSRTLGDAGALAGSVESVSLTHPDPERLHRALRLLSDPAGTPVSIAEGPIGVAARLRTVDGRVVDL